MVKNVFISGGSGFIGGNIIQKLSSKYIFLAPTHRELDLLDEEKVEIFFIKNKIDVVIHCSNVGGTRKSIKLTNVLKNNLKMFFNLVRMEGRFSKMIFLGSGAEYDKRRSLKKVKESEFDKKIPFDDYGYSKYICSKYIQKANNIVNLRLFGVFGKNEDVSLRFISQAICKNILGLPIEINRNVYFDYLYIDDLVRIVDMFIQKFPKQKFLNTGRGKKVDLITVAKMVNYISEKRSDIILKNKGLNHEYSCDNTLLLDELPRNFKFSDLKTNVKDLYEYYKNIPKKKLKKLLRS